MYWNSSSSKKLRRRKKEKKTKRVNLYHNYNDVEYPLPIQTTSIDDLKLSSHAHTSNNDNNNHNNDIIINDNNNKQNRQKKANGARFLF